LNDWNSQVEEKETDMIETEELTGMETLLRVLSRMSVHRTFSLPDSEWSLEF
jgi:hypothetical protein